MTEYKYNGIIFEWHAVKAAAVLANHSVTFEEAATVFFDNNSISKDDNRHYHEPRIITVGMSNQARLLTVIWTPRNDKVRLITAFKSTKTQTRIYSNESRY